MDKRSGRPLQIIYIRSRDGSAWFQDCCGQTVAAGHRLGLIQAVPQMSQD
jgi:hypothetical protein